MKKFIIYTFVILSLGMLSACDADKPEGDSIFRDETTFVNDFDKWLDANFVDQYNIRFIYRLLDIESAMNFYLVPVDYEQARFFAKVTKHALLEPYDQLVGTTFLKNNFPKMLHIIGNNAYNNIGAPLAGVAEGGMKITLYGVNDITFENKLLMDEAFHTCHHEFAHILHQTRSFSEDYRLISGTDYLGDSWQSISLPDALNVGFISQYSSKEYTEDFVEVYSIYITNPKEYWENNLNKASPEGRERLQKKLEIVRDYFQSAWGIDIDQLQSLILDRNATLQDLDYTDFSY